MEPLRLSTEATVGHVVVTVCGEADLSNSTRLYDYLHTVISRHGAPLILDLSGLTFVDCAGLRPLIRIRKRLGSAPDAVRLVSPPPHVEKFLRLLGMDRVMPICRSAAEALRSDAALQS